MQLSKNFSLLEFTRSRTADRLDIDNTPSDEIIENLKRTAEGMQKIRKVLGDQPIRITSGYRCYDLNKAVGGVPNSDHLTGSACDFQCNNFGDCRRIYEVLCESNIVFNQLILEHDTWIHVSFTDNPKNEKFEITKKGRVYG